MPGPFSPELTGARTQRNHAGEGGRVHTVERRIRQSGWFLRRRDLLRLGYSDHDLRTALGAHRIFRVRQGWYSVPQAPPEAVRAVRVGGRLTGLSALESYGIRVPRRATLTVAVPGNACRHRDPDDRRCRLEGQHGVRIVWTDSRRENHVNRWRVSVEAALVHVLGTEPRDVAVACASAAARHQRWSPARVRRVFDQAPERARRWLALVNVLDESHGESFVRLWLLDVGITPQSQPQVLGVGRLDFRVSDHVYVEVDGAQHDPAWTGEQPSSYHSDHERDALMAARGNTTLRFTYRQLYGNWHGCLAAIERAIADDRELTARRARDPVLPRAARPRRKRRRFVVDGARKGVSPPQ